MPNTPPTVDNPYLWTTRIEFVNTIPHSENIRNKLYQSSMYHSSLYQLVLRSRLTEIPCPAYQVPLHKYVVDQALFGLSVFRDGKPFRVGKRTLVYYTSCTGFSLIHPSNRYLRDQPCQYGPPRHVMRCFLATGNFDTFAGELFRFHDEFYVELFPRQYNYTVNTPMQYTSEMRRQLVIFMMNNMEDIV